MLRNWLTLTIQDILESRNLNKAGNAARRSQQSHRQPKHVSEFESLEVRALLSAANHGIYVDSPAAGAVIERTTIDADDAGQSNNRSGGGRSSSGAGSGFGGAAFGDGSEFNGNGLEFNFNPAAGMSQQAIDGFRDAANLWSAILTDDIIVNINIDFRALGAGILGQASSSTQSISYTDYRSSLIADSLSSSDATAVANLPAGPNLTIYTSAAGDASDRIDNDGSTNNRILDINTTTSKAVGLRTADNAGVDANIAFSSNFTWDFDRTDGITGGAFDFIGVAAHEIGHALGFRSGVDLVDARAGTGASVDNFRVATGLDIFRFSAQSVAAGADIDMQAGTETKFFSIDGGATQITTFSQGRRLGDGQQASHWKDNRGIGIMDPTAAPGEYADITEFDVQAMDVTGWDVNHDFGDAPDTTGGTNLGDYQTTIENNGPRHDLFAASGNIADAFGAPKVFLGAGTSRDFVAQTNGTATADNDDGVTIPQLVGETTVQATVVSTGGELDYFVDFNSDGDFTDAGESFSATVPNGTTTVDIVVPASVVDGTAIARFRLSSAGGLGSLGPAADGEVEDYLVNLAKAPTELYLNEILVDPNTGANQNPNEYIELRGIPNTPLDDIYLVFLESDSGGTLGSINNGTTNVVPLSGHSIGSNGFVVIIDDQDHPYSVAAGTTIIDVADLDVENASWTAMLIEVSSGSAIPSNQDLDVDDNGLDTLPAGWDILDSVAVLDGGTTDRGYSQVVFSADGDGTSEAGGTVVDVGVPTDGVHHIMRVGDSTGQSASDWVAFEHDSTNSGPPSWKILSSSNPNYFARNEITNHLGETNPTAADSIEPEINVQFGTVDIADGDTTPSRVEGTNFGFVLTTGSTKTRTFTIQNTGAGPLDISAVNVSGSEAADFTISNFTAGRVAINETLTFDVVFDPSADASRSATIEIINDDTDENLYTFDVIGAGTAVLAPEIQISAAAPIADGDTTPNQIDGSDFGNVAINSRSRSQTFTIANVGSASLTVSALNLSGLNSADFVISNFTAGTVAVDAVLTFDITFDPSAEGTRLAAIEVVNNDADENPYDFSIGGVGVTESALTTIVFNEILVDPNSDTRNFDTDGDGTAEEGDQFFELYNTSTDTLDVSGFQVWTSSGTLALTIPVGTFLGPNAHLVVVNSTTNGSLPNVPAGSLALDSNGSLNLLTDGDNLVVYDSVTDEFIQAISNNATVADPVADYTDFSPSATRFGTVLDFGNDTNGTSRALSLDGDTTNILNHNAIGNTAILATPGAANVAPGNASDGIIITEIQYNPASTEDNWEWVELANISGVDVFVGDWVIDDRNPLAHSEANIGAGVVPANGTAVLYNVDDVTAADFEAAWGFGINLIPVSNWSAISLGNSGDTIGLWESFADYSGDNTIHNNAAWSVEYDDASPWPRDDGRASIYLTDLTASFEDGANWSLSTVGTQTPAGGVSYASRAAGGNSGSDIGSPGGIFPGLTVVINSDSVQENAGNAATTVTITRTGDLTLALNVTLLSDDTTEATIQSTLTIPAGLEAINVNLNAVDDALIDGTRLVTITASAAGVDDGNDTVNVLDNDSNALILDIAHSSVSETAGIAATTITISRDGTSGDVTVDLLSSDITEATVPMSVVIPDGQTSVAFSLDAIDDDILDGDQTVEISATAIGFTSGSINVDVTDDEFLATDFFLNEVMFNPNGSDTGNEYIELRGTPDGFLPDDAYILLIEGDASNQGVLDQRFDIGGWRLGSNGYLVLLQAGNAFTTDADSTVVTATGTGWGTDFSSRADNIEDGSVTVLVVQHSSEPAVAVDYDADNDGTLDGAAAAWTIADAYGNLDGGPTDTAYGLINTSSNGQGLVPAASLFFSLNGFHSDYAGRIGDSTGSTESDWVFAEVAGGSPNYTLAAGAVVPAHLGAAPLDHVGSTNNWAPPITLNLTINAADISENGGATTATLIRTQSDISVELVVTLSSSDLSEATVPSTVTIPANSDSITFPINAVDDAIADGSQTVVITASAVTFSDGVDTIDILDDDSSGFAIVETEGNTVVTEAGSTDTFTVVLNSQPVSDVVLTVVASDPGEAVVSTTAITFSNTDWSIPQTITVTGVDDIEDDGDQVSVITLSVDDAASDDAFDSLVNQTVGVTTLDDEATVSLIFSEIMFNPASTEDNWEWIEVYNTTNTTIDLTGWVIDDGDGVAHSSSNIATGSLAAQSTAVLFNVDDVDLVDFQAAWGVGINLIPVTNWSILGLSNVGDTIGLWDSFSNYDGDNVDQAKTIFSITYDDSNPWPVDDGTGSIFLTDLDADPAAGSNWALSTNGAVTPAAGSAYISRMVGGNSGADIGSPGGAFAGLTVVINDDAVQEDAGNAASTVTITRSGDVSAALTVALTSNDITEAMTISSVLIPAGQAAVSVDLEAVDDALVDGDQVATITASAAGFDDGSDSVVIIDNDAPTLTMTITADAISENGGASTATVIRNTDTSADLVVTLTNDDQSEASVPATVTILAGQDFVTFSIDAVNDTIVDGTQTVTITATALTFANAVDSIDITDDEVTGLTISFVPMSVTENGGVAIATLSRNSDTIAELLVSLSSDDLSEAEVPATVTIPAGESSVTFMISAVDDSIVDGTQTVSVTGTATSHADGVATLDITDDDVAALNITFDQNSISENGGVVLATVTRNTVTTADLIVTLQNGDLSELNLPTSVTIPAGSTTASFRIDAVDDLIVDGTQAVTVTSTATGHASDLDTIEVTDDDIATLMLTTSLQSISENGGIATATLTRNTDSTAELVVTLQNSDTTEASFPGTITIPAGASSIDFLISGVDDLIVDGTQTVTVTATATGFSNVNKTVDVTDDDVATLTIELSPASISENGGSAIGLITRNTDPSPELIVTIENGDPSEANIPTTLTIPAGSAFATFSIAGIDDDFVDGTQTVSVTATATGFIEAGDYIDVTDDDIATLSITISPDSISENGGTTTATISRNTDSTAALLVTLENSDITEASVPTTVLIPAGSASAMFVINAINDDLVDGTQAVSITGKAGGFRDAVQILDVTDDDGAAFTVTIDAASISENGGSAIGTVTRNTDSTSALVVWLSSDDTTEATLPPSVTIPAGSTSVTFPITAVDDNLVDSTQTVNISAEAPGFSTGFVTINVDDDEVAGFSVAESHLQTVVSETGTTDTFTVVLSAAPLTPVTFFVSSSDISEATVYPSLLVFDSLNWDVAQTVTVTGIDDSLLDATQTSQISITVDEANSDSAFQPLSYQLILVDTLDDDKATASINRLADGLESSSTPGKFLIVLSDAPATATTITYSVSGTAVSGLDFTALTGTIAVAAGQSSVELPVLVIDDDFDEISESVVVTLTGGDVDIAADASTATLLIVDNDEANISASRTSLSLTEDGSSDPFTVALTSRPTSDVIVHINVSDASEVSVNVSTLTFTSSNWDVPQTVTATGVDDALVDGLISSSIVLSTDFAAPGPFASADHVSIAVTTSDNDTAAPPSLVSVTFFNQDAGQERNLSPTGTGQRSMVRRVEVVLQGAALISSANGFSAVNQTTGANVAMALVSSTVVGDLTTVVLEFTSELDPATRPDPTSQSASLKDGLYRFFVDGVVSGIDVSETGAAAGTATFNFHRLFGDGDGDRDVDGRDFRLYFQAFRGDTSLDAVFDFDNDGQLFRDLDDLFAFRGRYGRRI